MQRGIDTFFKRITPATRKEEAQKPPESKKRRAVIVSSDEDEVPESPQVEKAQHNKKVRTEESTTTSNSLQAKSLNKPTLSKLKKELKRVDPAVLFGGETHRIEAKKPSKPKQNTLGELEDDEIDKSLLEINLDANVVDEEKPVNGIGKHEHRRSKSKTPRKSPRKPSKSPKKEREERHDSKGRERHDRHKKSLRKEKSEKQELKTNEREVEQRKTPQPLKVGEPEKKVKQEKSTSGKAKDNDSIKDEAAKKSAKPPKMEHKKEKSTPKAKKHEDLESSVLSDEERHERKRMSAILYQKFKNRSSVINPGSKEVPKGKPNCLAGLSFLVTGVLESLERDETSSIIKEYGGKVMSTVGKRLNYLIVGEEAGPKKLAQAEEYGIKTISEDDFLNLIRERSGERTANAEAEQPSTSTKNSKRKRDDADAKNKSSDSLEKKTKLEKVKPEEKTIKTAKKSPHSSEKKPKLEKIKTEETAIKTEKIKVEKESNYNEQGHVEPESQQKMQIANEKQPADDDMLAWVDKYKPTSVKDIVGQFGASSNVTKLTNWLSKWYVNHDGKKKLQKPNPWAKNDDGSFYKAALLSGPPGIGKTTTATLVCKELGFDAVEFNASDTRSKRLLKEEVAELLSNKSLYGYCHGKQQAITKKHVLIMDEVDGMAGNEDRGGIQELIALIKDSSVPIICMCNDRNHQKMRSLVNYCYDLRFNKPRLEQIKGRILSICFKEKFKIEPAKVEEIIAATNNDIRQSINHISLLSAGKDLQLKTDASSDKTAAKDLKLGPWEVVRKVFSADEHKRMNFNDKCELFFHDYSMSPLFVQQNYLQVMPAGPKSDVLRKVALAADALSLGDLVDKRIRSNSAWTLLPTQAVFSSVMPGEYMSGHFTGQINFPGWLGKYSRSNKRNRLAQELHDHTRLRTSGSRQSMRLDYASFLLRNIVRPLQEQGNEGVEESLSVLREYHLLREDIDSLIELTTWPGPMDAVDGRVKAALTRAFNKEGLVYSYSANVGVKKKRAEAADDADLLTGLEGEEESVAVVDSDEEKGDDLENDGLIKAKKTASGASTSKSASSGSSKAKAVSTSKKPAGSKPKASKSKQTK